MSSFIDSEVGLVLSIWFVLALLLNSENNFINAKLMTWVWFGVAIMNRRIILYVFFRHLLTNHLRVKQLNYVWLTTEIITE